MNTERHITERISDIEEIIGREIDIDEYNQAQIETIDFAGTTGQYHFWIDLGGFCQGDATKYDIENDCKLLGAADEQELYSKLNDIFLEKLKKIVGLKKAMLRISEWRQTIMRDSFGDLTDNEFKIVFNAYIDAIKNDNPSAHIDIKFVDAIGSEVGENEVTWSDGDVESTKIYSDEYSKKAFAALDKDPAGGQSNPRKPKGERYERF
jgi:hypothetical protein